MAVDGNGYWVPDPYDVFHNPYDSNFGQNQTGAAPPQQPGSSPVSKGIGAVGTAAGKYVGSHLGGWLGYGGGSGAFTGADAAALPGLANSGMAALSSAGSAGGTGAFAGAHAAGIAGASNSAMQSGLAAQLGVSPLLLGAGFMAAAPFTTPLVMKAGNKLAHMLYGAPTKIPYSQADALKSTMLDKQVPGFSGIDPARRGALLDEMDKAGILNVRKAVMPGEQPLEYMLHNTPEQNRYRAQWEKHADMVTGSGLGNKWMSHPGESNLAAQFADPNTAAYADKNGTVKSYLDKMTALLSAAKTPTPAPKVINLDTKFNVNDLLARAKDAKGL